VIRRTFSVLSRGALAGSAWEVAARPRTARKPERNENARKRIMGFMETPVRVFR